MGADEAFRHSTPELYDRYMSPLFFEPCAKIVADFAASFRAERILETAAGTGIVTRAIHHALPNASIVATDLNEEMLAHAAKRLHSDQVSFQTANAQSLPFDEESFDLVVCQFGIMFFPDRRKANREARRVLHPNGHYLVVTFDALDRNQVAKVVGEAVAALFPKHPPTYMEQGPFCYTDPLQLQADLLAGGFTKIEIQTLPASSRAAGAYEAAFGICQGGPFRSEIEKRDPQGLDRATDAAAEALRQFEGPNGLEAPMSAHFAIATK